MPRVRRIGALLVSVACLVAGSLTAHAVTYASVIPDPGERAQVMQATGHGYLEQWPLICAALLVIAVIGVVGEFFAGDRMRRAEEVAAWPFALAAPLGFALQEHLERFIHDGQWPWTAVLDPTFSPGLAIQLPFAWLAWRAARLLLQGARAMERHIAARRRPRLAIGPELVAVRRAPRILAPRRRILSSCAAGRAPPRAALSS